MNNTQHGGNIYKKAKELGIPENQILDFSANINPLGLPDHVREAMIGAVDGTVNYPDPDCQELVAAISRTDKVREEDIVCGNGGADMLYRLAYGLKPGKVLLPVPSFAEYEEALEAAGSELIYYRMDRDFRIREDILDAINEGIDLVVLCNPNNPTGLLVERELTGQILKKVKEVGARFLMDECFLDICRRGEDYSMIPLVRDYPQLIILKSFTKMYAIPGVRLGYMICSDPEVTKALRYAGQAWPVSYIAQKAGLAALSRPDYRQSVIDLVEEELEYMKEELKKLPLEFYDGAANYIFFRAPGITDLDRRLERRGILIRNCSNYVNLGQDYWRIAVKTREENQTLIRALTDVLTDGQQM